ncbi:hypothetical protein EI94DRAFT_1741468 [Lactarius quietus]|nr:hypothetical protein EI94DRAFT_1741468 [Lactarius quietus]
MSHTPPTVASASRFQAIFQAALKSYQRQTKKDLLAHPLASQLQSCDSTSAILAVFQDQVQEFDKSRSGDERLTKWLGPTVNVLVAFSAAVSGGVGLVFSPANVIFAGIGVFISAAQDVAASKDILAELFERIGCFFARLDTYTKVAPTPAMTEIITQIMVEVLIIFGVATKELRRGSAKKFLRKLAGMADLEGALKKLDRLTQEEARMALAEVLRITHNVLDDVRVVDGKVESVEDKVDNMGNKVADVVQSVDENVKVVINDGKQAKVEAKEAKSIIQQTANLIDEVKWNQLKQLLRSWLSPADPSINHNIARKAQLKGSAVWLFQGTIIIEWKSTGSLLWVYGKRASSIVEEITAIRKDGSSIMAYFYFDFRDLNKQTCHHLLLSLVSQLSNRSSLSCDILHRVYETHEKGTRQPSDDTLKECLKEILSLPGQGPIFIILDALDEYLHICATSRPEADIRAALEPLAFRSVSLHDESGQKTDIADYVRTVVNLSPSMAMRRWRDDDKNLVIETLIERADGMFRWVFCQLETLRHCLPPNLRQFLNELPEGLDETYERILRSINKAQTEDARRLLQCLTVAARPLGVEELAELLAFDFQATSERGIPTLKEDWRWNDQEEAVLSTCSSLITIVRNGHSRVVQFSHFSVKEYLTSPRLARSHPDVSRFHVDLNAAHTILAQACLGTLLRPDEHAEKSDAKRSPLVKYAAKHWVEHARFENVSSRIEDGMDDLFDRSKPHFAAWLRVHNIDKSWSAMWRRHTIGSPLYYAHSACDGGLNTTPLLATLSKRHFRVASLLLKHGAVVDASSTGSVDIMRCKCLQQSYRTPLHMAARIVNLNAVQVLLEHKPSINLRDYKGQTPLDDLLSRLQHSEGQIIIVVRRLLEHGADPNLRDDSHTTPLHRPASKGWLEVARLLLSYGAKVDEMDGDGHTPSRVASLNGYHEMAKLLSEHGAVLPQ